MSSDDSDRILRNFAEKYPPLITIGEAAEIARVPVDTIYDWSHRGLLDNFKSKRGRRVLFDRDAFVRFILDGSSR